MPLSESLPDQIHRKLGPVLDPNEEIRIAVESDMDADGRFVPSWLIVTDRRVMSLGLNGSGNDIAVPLEKLTQVAVEPLVGGSCIEVSTAKDTIPLIRYSQSRMDRFNEAHRGIEQHIENRPFLVKTDFPRVVCETCGRRLPVKDGLCPACVSKWGMLKRICSYLKAHRTKVIVMVALFSVLSLAELLPPKITQLIIDDAFANKDRDVLFWYVAIMAGLLIIRWLGEMVNGWLTAWLGARVVADMRGQVYRHLEFLSLGFHDKQKTGGLLSRVTFDTRNVRSFLVDGLPFLVLRWLTTVGIIAMLLYTNWVLTLYILIPVPLIVIWGKVLYKRLRVYYTRLWRRWEGFYTHIQESLSGIRIVKAFAQESREVDRFKRNARSMFELEYWTEKQWISYFSTMGLLNFLGFIVVWLVGGQQVLGQELTMGELMLFYFYLHMFYGPLRWLGRVNSWMTRAMSAAERIFEIIDTQPEAYDDEDAAPMPHTRGDIVFERVTFGYDAALPVLKDIDIHIESGEMIGLVGKSGAGKSTTVNLICRFYDVDYGVIKLDGVDIRDIRLEDLRRHIGVVMQEPILFNGTIRENISYGRPEATFDEIMEAARAANAHHFILTKPDGYDTILGEKGTGLSGGEKQRVSIARAILHDPRILILDEATSSVDAQTEKQLQEAIARLIEGRTTIAIAHRLSTLRDADRLVVLDQGRVVEVGTHGELVDKRGHFHHLVHLQKATAEIIEVA